MIFVFLFVKPGKCFVELGTIGIIFYSALKKIFAERKIFALRFDPQGETRLRSVVHCGDAGVPGHVPCGHVPKQERARLQRRDVLE